MKHENIAQDNLREHLLITKKKFISDIDNSTHKFINEVNPFAAINEMTKKKLSHIKIFQESSEDNQIINFKQTENIIANLQDEYSSTEIQTPTNLTRIHSNISIPEIKSLLFKYEKKRNFSPDKEILENQNFYMSKKRKISKSQVSQFVREIDLIIPESKERINFRLFKDEEIGFNSHWQNYIHDQEVDEDIESADETIENATDYLLEKLEEGIKCILETEFTDVHNNQLK
jgi:hypothetical protein